MRTTTLLKMTMCMWLILYRICMYCYYTLLDKFNDVNLGRVNTYSAWCLQIIDHLCEGRRKKENERSMWCASNLFYLVAAWLSFSYMKYSIEQKEDNFFRFNWITCCRCRQLPILNFWKEIYWIIIVQITIEQEKSNRKKENMS